MNWFNGVDATYRADLRELNELNFTRFDAKLEQRLAESDARWTERMTESDARWTQRWAESDALWTQRWSALDAKLAQLEARFDVKLAELKSHLIKWTFVFWAPTALALVGLLLRR